MQIISTSSSDDSKLEAAIIALQDIGIKADPVSYRNARVVSLWGDEQIDSLCRTLSESKDSGCSDKLTDEQKAKFWGYASGSLSGGLEDDGYERISDLYEQCCGDNPDVSLLDNTIVVIQIHHVECDTSDDYVEIIAPPFTDKESIIKEFNQVLRESEPKATESGCRMTWLDMAISDMSNKYIAAAYCDKRPETTTIELSWTMFD